MLIKDFLQDSVDEKLSVDEQVEFLKQYTPEKIKAEELHEFAEFMRQNMPMSLNMPGAIDICGTGGSGLDRINTSTIASFIINDLGVGVAKHGNKAASGRFGSFDLLEALWVDIEMDDLESEYEKNALAFIYARKFHPVMKYFVEARKKIDGPTVFNILGPLLNPANPSRQIIGTSFKNQMKMMAEACKLMGKDRVIIVRGEDGLDEVTLTGTTDVVELVDGEIKEYQISPADFGIESCSFDEISGGDSEKNIQIAREILSGNCKTRHADLVYINSALALYLVGKVKTLREGYLLAKGDILKRIARTKKLPLSDRSFYDAISGKDISLIAEIKKASPSEGLIFKDFEDNFNPCEIAESYENANVAAISVLTDENFFQGSFQDLEDVQSVTEKTPLLCKDFIVSEYQIQKARDFGADAVLLIAALLTVNQMQKYLNIAKDLNMDCICEVHNEEELEKVLLTDARIVGINNRNLKTFEVDLETTNRLVPLIPEELLIISESGIRCRADIKGLDPRVNAVLIGTALMKAENIQLKILELTT